MIHSGHSETLEFSTSRWSWLIAMALVVMAICISGPAIAKDEIIVLRNVVLLDRETEDSESDVMISIRVDRGKLDLVSADPISVEDATLALDARGGVLLGSLTIGEPASSFSTRIRGTTSV